MKIEELDLDYNLIEIIPDDFNGKKLRLLNLCNNSISNIPINWDIVNLKILFLCMNKIKKIPIEWNIKNIEEIIFRNSDRVHIPNQLIGIVHRIDMEGDDDSDYYGSDCDEEGEVYDDMSEGSSYEDSDEEEYSEVDSDDY